MKFNTIEELLEYTKEIRGKTFQSIDTLHELTAENTKDKGKLGKIVETGFYKYPNNNKAEADFANLGVELKVTGFKRNKNGTIRAKERLVLGKINFSKIVEEEFNLSHLFIKSKKMLIIWYEYIDGLSYKDMVITDFQMFDMTEDEEIMKNDFEIIKQKVVDGKAHLLSEGDTSYLGACPKGATGKDRTTQPFSPIKAMPRGFCLKNSYMTALLRNANLMIDVASPKFKTIKDYICHQISRYIGKTQLEIFETCLQRKIKGRVPKNINKMISDKLIGKDKELPKKDPIFQKVNYIIKNLPVDEKGYPLERMSFRNLTLSEFQEDWENSNWKSYFEEVTIIVLCYQGKRKSKNGERILKEIKQVSFTAEDIDLFEKTYNQMKETIKNHDISLLPQPNTFTNQVLEIAPRGVRGDDAYQNLFQKDNTKVCFMLNKDFLFSKLTDIE